MKNNRKSNQTIKNILLLLCISVFLTGCTLNRKQENIDLGMTAIQTLDYEGALAYFEKALVNGEDKQLICRGQGLAYMGLTQYEESRDSLLKALSYNKRGPDDLAYDINYYLATAYYKLGDYEGALDTYTAIVALRPKESDAYYLRGSVEMDNGQYDAAIADFEKAMELAPDNYDIYIDIYLSCDKNGYTQVGQDYLKKLLQTPEIKLSQFDKGRISYYLKDYETARNALEEARSEDNKKVDVILMLGQTYEALGDYNYAANIYAEYIKKDEKQPEVYNQLGLCKLVMKDYDAALAAFQSALKLENNDIMQTLQYNEIVTYEYLSDYKQAAVKLEKYLKSYPGDTKAQREYQFLKSR
ncbi:MAG: tetratricopeptide repeat protein [Lachnospiraceae bacterium]